MPLHYAVASTSCWWDSLNVTIVDQTFNIAQKQSVGGLTLLLDSTKVSTSPSFASDCSNGGSTSQDITQTDIDPGTNAGYDGNDALYFTSIPGIVYKMGIHCSGTGDNCDGATRNNQILWGGHNSWPKTSGSWYPWDSPTTWTVYIKVYQTSSYKNSEITTATATSGNLANYILGGSRSYATMSGLKLKLTGSYPTCDTTAISSSGGTGNTINMGDYQLSELNTPKDVSFTLKLSNCVLPQDTVTVALSSTNADKENGNLLANTLTSGQSEGVGLRIKDSTGNTMKPGGAAYKITSVTGDSVDIGFKASMEKEGGTSVQAGSFSTHAILSLSYN